jgi:hypothetical protein
MKSLVVVFLVAASGIASADNPCDNVHYMRAFDPALGRSTCAELQPTPPDPRHPDPHPRPLLAFDASHPAKVLHAGTSPNMTREETTALVELQEIATTTARAAAAVRMPLPEKITVYLDPNEIAAENRPAQLQELAAARTAHAAEDKECVVAYHYKSTDVRKKLIAVHQLFHCIVTATFEEGTLMDTGDADWWAEGSAEFFASIAYPGNTTDVDAEAFHASESQVLFRRSADAALFFDWYSNKGGKLKGLLDTVHDKQGTALMAELKDDVGDHWLEFEEAYFDHSITAPGGTIVNYSRTPAPPTSRINASTSKTFTADPYVIHGAILEFAEGKAYDLDGGAENDFKWKWSEGDAGAWSSAPTTVHTCHQMRRYRIVMAAKDREVTKRLRITARDEHESDCPCLAGGWQQTGASLARLAQRLQQRGVHNAQCSLAGGGTLLQFTADHNGGETYQGLHVICTGRGATSDGVSQGTRSFTWTPINDTQFTMNGNGGDAVDHITVTARGFTTHSDAPITSVGSGTITYRCTRTDLHLELQSGASTDAFDYTRAGDTPHP